MIQQDKLREIVGAENVINDIRILNEWAIDMSFVNSVRPACVVRPKNANDVEKIVKLANETLTTLVPVSSGAPHFRGDTVPSREGAVIVDLSGMKKVIRVDRLNRVAMFEPAVTFGELIPAVTQEGLRLNMPLLPRKSKSVVGSLLEREPVVMPGYHWDMSDPLNCVEIVFGIGDTFRTGSAAGPGTIEQQWAAGGAQVEGSGPTQFSLNRIVQGAQGTMGIVTWASARCELLPALEEPFLIGSSQLDKILEMVHWLVRLRLVNECLVLNNADLAAITALKGPGDYYKIKALLPTWILFYNLAGYKYLPEKRVSFQIKDIMDLAQRVGVEPVKTIGKVMASELLRTLQHPSDEPYWKIRHKGACQDIFFITLYGKVQDLIREMFDLAEKVGYPTSDIGIYLQPIVQGVNCHCEFNLFYDPENPLESGRVRELTASSTIERLMARGAFFSRPYGEAVGTIYHSSASTVAALRKVKSILDPNNIMNTGKLCF
jgi:FAD/FMN-containing dehydrogenase